MKKIVWALLACMALSGVAQARGHGSLGRGSVGHASAGHPSFGHTSARPVSARHTAARHTSARSTSTRRTSAPRLAQTGGSHEVRAHVRRDGVRVAEHRARNPTRKIGEVGKVGAAVHRQHRMAVRSPVRLH
jgi:hypothetical protein